MTWLRKYQVGIFCLLLIFTSSVVAQFNKENGEIVGLSGGGGATAYPKFGALQLDVVNSGITADVYILPNGNRTISRSSGGTEEASYYGVLPCSYKLGSDIKIYFQWHSQFGQSGSQVDMNVDISTVSDGIDLVYSYGAHISAGPSVVVADTGYRALLTTLVGGFSAVNTTIYAIMVRSTLTGNDTLFGEVVDAGGFILTYEMDASGCTAEFVK